MTETKRFLSSSKPGDGLPDLLAALAKEMVKENEMTVQAVLVDLLEDNRRRLHRFLKDLPDECFFWQPEPGANSIAVTLWHMGRIFDVFLTQQAQGFPSDEECWFKHGWFAQTGYDPRGLGLNGWGILTGFSLDEVAAMPPLARDLTIGYLNDVYDTVKSFLETTPDAALQTPGVGFNGQYTLYQCLQMPLLDNIRHLGEIFAIKSRWDR